MIENGKDMGKSECPKVQDLLKRAVAPKITGKCPCKEKIGGARVVVDRDGKAQKQPQNELVLMRGLQGLAKSS